MGKQIEITESLLKRGIEQALSEMGAGLTEGMSIGGIVGLRPDGGEVLLKGARVTVTTLASPHPVAGIRLAAFEGRRV